MWKKLSRSYIFVSFLERESISDRWVQQTNDLYLISYPAAQEAMGTDARITAPTGPPAWVMITRAAATAEATVYFLERQTRSYVKYQNVSQGR